MGKKIWLLVAALVFLAAPAFGASVADFYKGRTIRVVVGFGPGGATDTNARLFAKVLSKHIPGNPTILIQNKPGGGSMLAANTVYNVEPKDGTVIASFSSTQILRQAWGAPGVKFDAAKYQWLSSTFDTSAMCAVRTDAGVKSFEDLIASGKEVIVSSFGKGGLSHVPPVVFNAVFGTKLKVITGYRSGAAQRLAVKNKEVHGFCTTLQTITGIEAGMFEGPAACCKVLIVAGSETEYHPFLKGVPAAEKLAEKLGKSKGDLAMLRAMNAPNRISLPQAFAPGVPKDRVQALRKAFDKAYKDPQLLRLAKRMGMDLKQKSGEEVARIIQELLQTPRPVLARIKEIVQ
ncbi:MAG: Bug family tripartite tricarboxylate transporter substrate binding protein [Candidatus Binatia bacterium]